MSLPLALTPVSGWQRLRGLTDSLAGAMLGAAVYAAWAVWINRAAGLEMALSAGAGHWLASTLLTYYGTAAMRAIERRTRGLRHPAQATALGGLALTYLVLLGLHLALGTPELLLTLAPGLLPNLLFCAGYAELLRRTPPPPCPR
ncbi:MAG TPA: hypothetical protein VFV27_03050 [Nevskiaceae bacterium]|nr:hypothetical protein [Nevskiaceae bacterium]